MATNPFVNKVVYGDQTIMDISDTTAAAEDVASGKYFYTASGQKVQGTITERSSADLTASNLTVTVPAGRYASQATKTLTDANLVAGNIKKDVTIFGTTGTFEGGGSSTGIKYIYSDVDGTGAWDVSGYAKVSYDYAPLRDNKWRHWYKVDANTGFTVTFVIYARANRVTIDWGDGTSQYATGTSPYKNTHTYATAGIYCAEASDPTNNRMDTREYCVGQSSSEPNYTLVGVELYGTSGGQYNQNSYQNCVKLKRVIIINGRGNSYMFSGCSSLEDIEFPNSVTSMSGSILRDCTSLRKLVVPSSVTSVSTYAFSGNTAMQEYHFKSTTPPTLSNTNAFTSIPSGCIIYVPYSADHSVLAAYQSATNWSTYASYMQEEPQ